MVLPPYHGLEAKSTLVAYPSLPTPTLVQHGLAPIKTHPGAALDGLGMHVRARGGRCQRCRVGDVVGGRGSRGHHKHYQRCFSCPSRPATAYQYQPRTPGMPWDGRARVSQWMAIVALVPDGSRSGSSSTVRSWPSYRKYPMMLTMHFSATYRPCPPTTHLGGWAHTVFLAGGGDWWQRHRGVNN